MRTRTRTRTHTEQREAQAQAQAQAQAHRHSSLAHCRFFCAGRPQLLYTQGLADKDTVRLWDSRAAALHLRGLVILEA